MRLMLQLPIRTASENEIRRMHWRKLAARTADERTSVARELHRVFGKRPLTLPSGGDSSPEADRKVRLTGFLLDNTFKVTLVRISPGVLDDDGVRGALKAIRDGVSDWIGLDDADDQITWCYEQLVCDVVRRARRGAPEHAGAAVRIIVEDRATGLDRDYVVTPAPKNIRQPGPHARRSASTEPREQAALPFAGVWARLPWEQSGDEPVIAQLSIDANGGDPPARINLRAPDKTIVPMMARLVEDDDLGRIWLYEVAEERT